jgi:hypothetical protein
VWGRGDSIITLLESFQASPARPSGKSSIKIEIYTHKAVRMLTVLAEMRAAQFVFPANAKSHNLEN